MKVYEVTGYGFDGSTDETDDRVLWVTAEDAMIVIEAIDGLGATFCCEVEGHVDEMCLDYSLPRQTDALRACLQQWSPK